MNMSSNTKTLIKPTAVELRPLPFSERFHDVANLARSGLCLLLLLLLLELLLFLLLLICNLLLGLSKQSSQSGASAKGTEASVHTGRDTSVRWLLLRLWSGLWPGACQKTGQICTELGCLLLLLIRCLLGRLLRL